MHFLNHKSFFYCLNRFFTFRDSKKSKILKNTTFDLYYLKGHQTKATVENQLNFLQTTLALSTLKS